MKLLRALREVEREDRTAYRIGEPIASVLPHHSTPFGAYYVGDSRKLLTGLADHSVNLVVTSPPYALHFKKEYGNVDKDAYIRWFLPFAYEIKRVLKGDGSFVLNIGGSYNAGQPTRSLYHFKLLIALCEEVGFHLAQECFWYNPAKLPTPAEWVNVRRVRIKDSVEYVWWLSPTPLPKSDNRNVLIPYSPDMERLIAKGFKPKKRPSGHNITSKFNRDRGGAIPSNVIIRGNNQSNSRYIADCKRVGVKIHPARYPEAIPEFFVKLLTDEDDLVLDPFAGSNITGSVAQSLARRWIAFEIDNSYAAGAEIRFQSRSTREPARR
jgi:site-specific DNA-methyltransferase (cytosine-N4-specific)